MEPINRFKIDRSQFSVDTLHNQAGNDEVLYWKDKSPAKRLEALELLRQIQYGYDPDTIRLHRIFEVVKQK